jgi:hypothetical protein
MRRVLVTMTAAMAMTASVLVATQLPASAAPVISEFKADPVSGINTVTLRWITSGGYDNGQFRLVYISGPRLYPTAPGPLDVGFQAQSTNGEEHTLTFPAPFGHSSYTLSLHDNNNVTTTASYAVDVPVPAPPLLTTVPASGAVSPFLGQDGVNPPSTSNPPPGVTINWTFPPGGGPTGDPSEVIVITRPDKSTVKLPQPVPSQYQVPGTDLQSFGDVDQAWSVQRCVNGYQSINVCTDPAQVTLSRAGDKFDFSRRNWSADHPAVTWSPGSETYLLTSPTLTLSTNPSSPHSVATTGNSLTLTNPPAGANQLNLYPCHVIPSVSITCLTYNVTAPVNGTITAIKPVNTELYQDQGQASVLATIAPSDGSPAVDVPVPGNGLVTSLAVASGATVNKNDALATLRRFATMKVQVGSPAFTEVSWQQQTDFVKSVGTDAASTNLFPVYQFGAAHSGLPLDLAALSNGDTFVMGEEQSSITQVTHAATSNDTRCIAANTTSLCDRDIPLFTSLQNPWNVGSTYIKTAPFDAGGGHTTSVSELGEGAIEGPPGQVFVAQGGTWFSLNPTVNHARIVRYDATNNTSCAWGLPESNNQPYGLAWDGTRIWVAEDRLPGPSVISSFNPATTPCTTNINYQDPSSVATLAYCPASTPFASTCITKLTLPLLSGTPTPPQGITHLVVDGSPVNGVVTLWVTDSYGSNIYQVVANTTSGSNTITRYPVPHASRAAPGNDGEPVPWYITTDSSFVYFDEFGDDDLVRMSKTPGTNCQSLAADGSNPCMSELHIDVRNDDKMNAIRLSGTGANQRLYFTLGNGELGYTNTSTWNGGTIYTGMGSVLVDPTRASVGPPSYDGLVVLPSGALELGDFQRKQIILLRPSH